MKLQTIQYTIDQGWSVKEFPKLDSEQTLILIFAAPEFIHNTAPIDELIQHFPQSKIMGCSSAGEIAGSRIYDHSLSVAIVRFEKTKLQLVNTKVNQADDSLKAGENLRQQLDREDLRAIFVLSDGLNINGTALVNGLNDGALKKNIIITGGLAGDGKDFKKTWIISDGKICTNCVAAVGFFGDAIRVGHGSRGGWDIFGPERRITRSNNNILYELDDQPALLLYKQYLGDRASGLPATGLLYPLAIRKTLGDEEPLVRTILAVDEKMQSLTFAGDMPLGNFAQLMRANFDRLISSASEAGQLATRETLKGKDKDTPILAVAVSCVGRRLVLGERTEEEIESSLNVFPEGTSQIGFYSYGELSPHTSGNCKLHNQTMTLTTFYETESE